MREHLTIQFHLLQAIRDFFSKEEFIDVLTPPMVKNPGMETHIHPFQLKSIYQQKELEWYLHTSPEFHMKELLSEGFEKIFTLSYCFRDEPSTTLHRPQFIMLEWYRAHEHYTKIMDDSEQLIAHSIHYLEGKNIQTKKRPLNFERITIRDIFREYVEIDILDYLESKKLYQYIKQNYPMISAPPNLSWDDYYFLLFLNVVEPKLINHPNLILFEYPAPLSALSTIKKDDPRVCERFEIYLDGIEIANCFNELTDLAIQKKRFEEQAIEKKNLYNYQLPEASILYQSLKQGLPFSSGIALGIERLLGALTGSKNIFWNIFQEGS